MVTVDLTKNVRQAKFFYDVMAMVQRHKRTLKARLLKALKLSGEPLNASQEEDAAYVDPLPYRIVAYGGAIRGGKTYVCLFILCVLCRMFPGSRWHVVRAAMPDLIRGVEPSLRRILANKLVRWKRAGSEYYVQFPNGSRIYFLSENFDSDKDLDRFKGLETNGFLLEQGEELNVATFRKCMERAGSWYLPSQPPAFVFVTFNPAYNWVREVFHEPWADDKLESPYYYMEALPDDNGFVTQDQWDMWKNMDTRTYARFVQGSWDVEIEGRFCWAYSDKKMTGRPEYVEGLPLHLNFDFNVDPSCATVTQTDGETWYHVLKEYRIMGGDTYRICDAIAADWNDLNPYYIVHGDAAGNARMSGARGAISQYHIIQQVLNIPWGLFHVPKSNPFIADSRMLMNGAIQKLKFVVHEDCRYLRHDLNFVQVRRDTEGKIHIMKTGKLPHAKENAQSMGHLLDTIRYDMHMTCGNLVVIHRS